MGVVLYVSPLVDPDREDEDRRKLRLVNERLRELGLPGYQDPVGDDANKPYWNAMFSNDSEGSLLELVAKIQDSGVLTFRHFLDPSQHKISGYIPIDFPDPIVVNFAEQKSRKGLGFLRSFFGKDDTKEHEEDLWLVGSCQGLLREVEQLAELLEIPLERFPIDYSGDGEDEGDTWNAVIGELREENAKCMRTQWEQLTPESAEQQFKQFCEMTGVPYEKFRSEMIEEHGSITAFFEKGNTDFDEDRNSKVVWALVNHWHGCKLAIERGLLFGIG